MSIKVMSWVWENGPTDATERLVLLAIADFCDDAGSCFPSMARIGAKACVSERGARGIVRRLETNGWLSVAIGGGRGGCSRYQVHARNPAQETGNDKPGMTNPETDDAKPGTRRHKTRNPGSAEPSLTIIEPSEEDRAREHLLPILGDELTDDWLAHRRAKKKPMTALAGKMLAKELRNMRDPPTAVRRAIANGWQGVVFKEETVTPFRGRNDGQGLDDHLDALKARLAVQRLE